MKMKSWRFHDFGDIKNLRMEEVNIPEPGQDEALVKVSYAGLNPADKFVVMGRYPDVGSPPYSVGRDGCGVVEIPGNSGKFKKGDKVVLLRSNTGITRDGTLAEYVAVREACLAPLPLWWDEKDGAAGPLVLLTNWQALSIAANLLAGETVVITGASGGIGTSALYLAKSMGARTIVLSRSEEKRKMLLEMGADEAFDTYDEELVTRISELGGADVVIENICGDFLAQSLKMLNSYGRVCVIGALGGIKSTINPLVILFKRLQIHGIQVGDYTDAGVQDAWEGIIKTLATKKIKVPIDKIFAFDQVQEAFDHMRQGPMGKVIIGPMSN